MAERILIEAGNGTFAVEGGRIAEPSGRYEVVLRVPAGEARPGLINAHDHLHFNHYGRLGHPPYADAQDWARDVQRRVRSRIAAALALPRRQALRVGAWKNLFAGVTSVVHHDPWEPDFDAGFPLRVLRVPAAHAPGLGPAAPAEFGDGPFCLHLAEGRSLRSAEEFRQVRAAGLLGPNLIAVHGLGIAENDIEAFRASGAALVWCPSSNLFLYGRTAPAALLAEGVDVLLGSDSLVSGAGNLLDELRLARSLELVSDARLAQAVGEVAARRLGLRPPALAPGEPADLVVLERPLLEATAGDVALVMVGGALRVAAPELLRNQPIAGGRLATVGGVTRWIDERPAKGAEAVNQSAASADLPRSGQRRARGA